MTAAPPQLAFIGFGEAAEAFATGWGRATALGCRAFDIRPEQGGDALPGERARRSGVTLAATRADALSDAAAVFCLVTADQALAAADECADLLAPGCLWLDGNSCAPGAKRRAATRIEAAGGRYVDLAIMAPVYPKMHKVPLLIAGPHAQTAAPCWPGWE